RTLSDQYCLVLFTYFFRFWLNRDLSTLHSFPTRRSSDLRPRYLALPRQNAMGIAHLLMQFALRGVDFRRYQVVHAHFGYPMGLRSEEHTSELQSRENIVCRLLLEKKKELIKKYNYHH